MLIAGICLMAAGLVLKRALRGRERPLDGAELQLIRRFGDQAWKEPIRPFGD